MSDVLTVLRGNLYDPGSMYDYWNLVISSNSHNKDNNIIICCLVKLLEKDREIEESDVVFDYRGKDNNLTLIQFHSYYLYNELLCKEDYKFFLQRKFI